MSPYIDKTCQYHSEHHKSLAENKEDIKTLYHKINEAEKALVKVETELEKVKTDLQNSLSRNLILSIVGSLIAAIIVAVLAKVL